MTIRLVEGRAAQTFGLALVEPGAYRGIFARRTAQSRPRGVQDDKKQRGGPATPSGLPRRLERSISRLYARREDSHFQRVLALSNVEGLRLHPGLSCARQRASDPLREEVNRL